MIIYQAQGREWKGNLHMHTTNSDGRLSPEDAISLYESQGYDFLAISDHFFVTDPANYRGKLLLLPGAEIDYSRGPEWFHLLAIGADASLLERAKRGMGPQELIDATLASKGLCFLAHPHWSLNRVHSVLALRGLSGAEIYNATSGPPLNADRADSTAILDILASEGCLLPTLACDDAHHYNDQDACNSYILLRAEKLNRENVMEALAKGHFYATQGPRFEEVRVEDGLVKVRCSKVKQILFHSNLPWASKRACEGDGLTEATYRLNPQLQENFVRVILIDENGKRAWLNPFKV